MTLLNNDMVMFRPWCTQYSIITFPTIRVDNILRLDCTTNKNA